VEEEKKYEKKKQKNSFNGRDKQKYNETQVRI